MAYAKPYCGKEVGIFEETFRKQGSIGESQLKGDEIGELGRDQIV